LLIHEATFEDEYKVQAKMKKHTTSSEALSVIKSAKPWRAILTHFSARNAHLPEILPQYQKLKVMIAFDQMRLNISDLEWAFNFLPIF